jgi:hypothetical protein
MACEAVYLAYSRLPYELRTTTFKAAAELRHVRFEHGPYVSGLWNDRMRLARFLKSRDDPNEAEVGRK